MFFNQYFVYELALLNFKKNVYRKALLELAPYVFSKEKLESVKLKLSL